MSRKQISDWVLVLAIAYPFSASASGDLVKFRGGIGVIPASSVAGFPNADGTFPEVNRNVVRGINPPGQPWRIAELRADVRADGRIKVRGRGLLLAGGNGIGGNANQSVFATLLCEVSAPFTPHNSSLSGVPLERNGDFRIDDVLTPEPSDCPSPVLLIRNVTGTWFAAGIVEQDSDDDD